MELDCYILGTDVDSIGDAASSMEALGFGCMWSIESQFDPFLPLVVAATRTTRLRLGTNIAVAFARSPMTVAQTAHDLHRLSGGRFVLGLGPQVKAHIERRYSMPWSRPVARMREFVQALRAIWDSWETGERLAFEGEFYRHTLMGPIFDAGPTGYGPPPIYLAGVGPMMTAAAGDVADGLLCHPLTTPKYLAEVTRPALAGPLGAGGGRRDFTVVASVLAATGRDDAAIEEAARHVRRKIAFYGATPAYRPMLDVQGLGDLQPALNDLARQARWADMTELVDDDVLHTFAVVGGPREFGRSLQQRFAGLADRATIYELDELGRLRLDRRYLAEPEPVRELMAGFGAAAPDP
jgi:probable F420-dependent oxidoreductase